MSGAHEHETPTATGRVDHLDAAECWTHLQGTALGRLAVVREDGTPDVFPVNFVTHEGSLYVRTARDSKLLHIAHHPAVAFEIDGETSDTRWSVVARGPAERVTSDAEVRASGIEHLSSWSPTTKHFVIRITAHTVTGRRFAKNAGRTDAARSFVPDASLPTPQDEHRPRAQRPEPIPHHTPRADAV